MSIETRIREIQEDARLWDKFLELYWEFTQEQGVNPELAKEKALEELYY